MSFLTDHTEARLDDYKALGAQFVVIYKHRRHKDLQFVEYYADYREYSAARRYWLNDGYVVNRLYDLDYRDWINEKNGIPVH